MPQYMPKCAVQITPESLAEQALGGAALKGGKTAK
jgi:hypothetical protein